MSLVGLLIACLVIGIAWWAISQIPMPQPIRIAVVVIFALIAIGMLTGYVPLPAYR